MPDFLTKLRAATAGLLYPSESDEPFEVITWPPARSAFDAVHENQKNWPITQIPVGDFFDLFADHDDEKRFVELRKLLVNQLADLAVFRIGEKPEIDIYVVGKDDGGAWVGVKTLSVET